MDTTEIEIATITVIGAGTMGQGIAHVAALGGYTVRLGDANRAAVQEAIEQIEENLQKGVDRGKLEANEAEAALGRISPFTDLLDGVAEADLVIEAIPEDIELKQSLFGDICKMAPETCILATNTSSLSVTSIASSVVHPERFIGMHFFNPPHIVKLLEIVRGHQTSDATLEQVCAVAKRMERELVVVNDSPGFATSRLGLILGLEAIRMLQEGVASAEDIDRAMEFGYRHPMGPLKLTDLVGLDVRLAIAEHLHRELGEHFRPPPLLRKLVHAGKLGKKTGEGFYRWD